MGLFIFNQVEKKTLQPGQPSNAFQQKILMAYSGNSSERYQELRKTVQSRIDHGTTASDFGRGSVSFNTPDQLRKIYHTLGAISQNKDEPAEIRQEALNMRRQISAAAAGKIDLGSPPPGAPRKTTPYPAQQQARKKPSYQQEPVQEARASSGDPGANCRANLPATVTVYSGNETGSAAFMDAGGTAITANHVIKNSGGQPVLVRLSDGTEYPASVVRTDKKNDLAVLQVDTEGQQVPAVRFGKIPPPGSYVCAIGSPYGRPGVVAEGSFTRLQSNGDLQSQIRLYPGNSGGPLFNANGEFIGINKAILNTPSGENAGISFSEPVQSVRSLLGR